MSKTAMLLCCAMAAVVAAVGGSVTAPAPAAPVKVIRTPNGGIQPQAVTDAAGTLHLIYFSGDPLAGDIYYVRSKDGGETFSKPLRVNSQQGSAIAVGNIRGARLALGRGGRVHVAWNGSGKALPKTTDGKSPMLYARLNDAGTAFEPQRNVITGAAVIDGGGAVAADAAGHVYVFWHSLLPGGKNEADRRVWVAVSNDDGKTFAAERVAWNKPTGACGCCGLDAYADRAGTLFVLFRSATEMVHRDMYLLTSTDHGASFSGADISKWNVGYCVMSSESFAESPAGVLGAWETQKQIYFGRLDPKTGAVKAMLTAPGTGVNRKFPAITGNRKGDMLLAWTDGMGWKKGGTLAWQEFDGAGNPLGTGGHAPGVPVWSLVAAFTAPDGSFRVMY